MLGEDTWRCLVVGIEVFILASSTRARATRATGKIADARLLAYGLRGIRTPGRRCSCRKNGAASVSWIYLARGLPRYFTQVINLGFETQV